LSILPLDGTADENPLSVPKGMFSFCFKAFLRRVR
jgi:hypothetical protein